MAFVSFGDRPKISIVAIAEHPASMASDNLQVRPAPIVVPHQQVLSRLH
jgi:hypothetical protein